MGEEAPKIKRPAGLGIFQPVTGCKDDSYGRLQDEPKRYRPAQPANEILPKIVCLGQPSMGFHPPRSSGTGNPLAALRPYKGLPWFCWGPLTLSRFWQRTLSFFSIKTT